MFRDINLSLYSLLNTNIRSNFFAKLFKLGIFQFNRFLSFNFNAFSYNEFYSRMLNFHHERNNFKNLSIPFLGFKIHCSGRFSRKQRASSYWFTLGRISLNTIKASIDYASYSLALDNSLITIKVWIHKSKYSLCRYRIQL